MSAPNPTQVPPEFRGVLLTPVILRQTAVELGPEERLFLGIIASLGAVQFPPREDIADMMGCSVRLVGRTIATLVERGWLVVTERRSAHGIRLASGYKIKEPERLKGAHPQPRAILSSGPEANLAVTKGQPVLTSDSDPDLKGLEKTILSPPATPLALPGIPEPGKPRPSVLPPPVPTPKKSADPLYKLTLAWVLEFRGDCESASGVKLDPAGMGKDIRMVRSRMKSYGDEKLRMMGAEFLCYCREKGLPLNVGAFMGFNADTLLHYAIKREENGGRGGHGQRGRYDQEERPEPDEPILGVNGYDGGLGPLPQSKRTKPIPGVPVARAGR